MNTPISIIILLTAIPLGLFARYLTNWEEKIYQSKQYFPSFLWLIAIAAAVFYTLNTQIALTLTYIFLLILIWGKEYKL